MTKAISFRNLFVTLCTSYFLKQAVTLSNDRICITLYAITQSNENASLTSVPKYICYSVEPLLIFDISSNDLPISPESLSRCFSKTGKNLSFSSSLPSVANPYQRVNNSSSFRSLVICFATAPIRICVVFCDHIFICSLL